MEPVAMLELASRALFDEGVSALDDTLLHFRGWQLFVKEYPLLEVGFQRNGVVSMRVRMRCDDWNDLPPSIEICDAQGALVRSMPQNLNGILNLSPHPQTGKPFICMRGSREYHTHPSHTADAWASIKSNDAFTLGGILTQIWRAWRKVPA
jgi:Predicted metal binding domain